MRSSSALSSAWARKHQQKERHTQDTNEQRNTKSEPPETNTNPAPTEQNRTPTERETHMQDDTNGDTPKESGRNMRHQFFDELLSRWRKTTAQDTTGFVGPSLHSLSLNDSPAMGANVSSLPMPSGHCFEERVVRWFPKALPRALPENICTHLLLRTWASQLALATCSC